MASFKQFIIENAHQGFDLVGKLRTVEDLISDKRFERSLPDIIAFQDGVAANALYNTVFNEAKDAVKRLLSDAYDKIWERSSWMKWNHPVDKQLRDNNVEVAAHLDAGNIKKALRGLEAAEKIVTDADALADWAKMKRLCEVFAYCSEAFKAVQTKVIKGRKPATPDPNAFHSHMGTAHSVATVRTHLLKSITEPLDNFESQLKSWFDSVLLSIDKHAETADSNGEVAPMGNAFSAFMMQSVYDYRVKGWGEKRKLYDLKRRPDADGYPAREAKRERTKIEESFLYKNALKLSALLDKKGNLTSIDVLPGVPVRLHNGAGTLTSSMKVKFADGSEFTVRNKVIINTSSSGNWFYQYPTTFHDVKLPDGSKLEMPSEEKMLKVFGG